MSRILVTGASGLLGLNFCMQFNGQHEIIGIVNSHRLPGMEFETRQVDLAQPGSAVRLISEVKPDIVLHCAALANIDAAEANPVLAERINSVVPGEIAAASRNAGAMLVHISTDAVFDGVMGNYTEDAATNPVNIYAQTKRRGEELVLAANPDAVVARVNFYGWSLSGIRSLGELFYDNLKAGKTMFGFTDVFFCPLQVNMLGEILLRMAELRLKGIYHVISREALSKYDFGCRVARQFDLDESLITPVSWKDGGLKAARSPNLTLRTGKLAAALGCPVPDQAPGLERFYQQEKEGIRERILQFAKYGE